MKKTLSLVLALVMVLGSFSAAFAAESVTTGAEAGAFLKAAGVLVGDENGNLNLGDNLSRQDAVILVAQLRGEIKAAQAFEGTATYEDVEIKFYNAPLAWAQENGLFVGHSEKVFGFNEDLTAQEYAKVLLTALGYKVAPNGDSDIKWAEALTKAQQFGILENLKVENATEITRGEMALMTFNALGVTMKDSKKTLADTLGIEMPAPDVLTATVKDTENLKEIVLELSNAKLADKDKLENTDNYKVVDNTVVKAEVQGNNVVVLLEDALLVNREYKLRVRSIDKAINAEYKFTAKDNTMPKVEEVVFYQGKGIKLITSEPIRVLNNDRGRTFVVDGKNIAMDVEIYGRNVILTPYQTETFSKNVETITITGLEDFAGHKTASEEFAIGWTEDSEGPELVDLILRGDRTVEAVFNKDVYIDSVEDYDNRTNVGNISYMSGRNPVYSRATDGAVKIDTNRVLYTFDGDFLRTRTDFIIEGVANHSNVKMKSTTMEAREILDNNEPEIFDWEIESKNIANRTATIRLFFDKEVNGDMIGNTTSFVAANHFRLYEREVNGRTERASKVSSANYATIKGVLREDVVDVQLVQLDEWNLTNEMDYVLEVENFVDQTSRRNRMFRDYVDFKFEATTGFGVNAPIKVVQRTNQVEVTINFSKPVSRASAEDLTNYIFEYTKSDGTVNKSDVKDLKGRIVTERDGYEVVIILPDFELNKYTSVAAAGELRILDTLKDTDNKRINGRYTYDFVNGTTRNTDAAQYTITAATAGQFNVTPIGSVDEITLMTDSYATFNILQNSAANTLKKVTVNVPNGDVVVPAGVILEEVEILAISENTLTINGTVNKVVISTTKPVSIAGPAAQVAGTRIESTVSKATVKVNGATHTILKDEPKVVNADGTLGNASVTDGVVGAMANLKTAITTGSGIELTVATDAAISVVTKKVQEKVETLIGRGYTVTVSNVNVDGTKTTENVSALFEVKDKALNVVNQIITFTAKFVGAAN